MAIAGTNITLDSTEGMDKISQTEKVTSPYFSNSSTTLAATNIVSSSLTDTNETYFFGISNNATPTVEEFNVAFGSENGFGSDDDANVIKAPTDAIYKQYSNMLLPINEVTGGFFISSTGNVPATTNKDTEIFILSARRSNMKDRLNKGTFTIILSGSNSTNNAGRFLVLTDDSLTKSPTATPMGDRYNIVSGSAGVVDKHINETGGKCFGHFYPSAGILVFSQAELSASIPGKHANKNDVTTFAQSTGHTMNGFGTGEGVDANKKFGLRFINCLRTNGAKLTFRDEEDQVSAQYFCRVRSGEANFSNNPTFVSGSLNELRQSTMRDNPTTFISQVQLYNADGDMVAVGSLSKPLKKNFSSEATIKVKLTY